MAACADVGRPWPDLNESQKADLEAWKVEVQQHAAALLRKSGARVRTTPTPPGTPSAHTLSMAILLDRTGYVHRVRVTSQDPDKAAAERHYLAILTSEGNLPPPPASIVALNPWLEVEIALNSPPPVSRTA